MKYRDFNDVFKKYSLRDLTAAQDSAALEQVAAIDRANKEAYKAWIAAHSALISSAQALYGKDSAVIDYLRKHKVAPPPSMAIAVSAWIKKVSAYQKKEAEQRQAEQAYEASLAQRRARADRKRQLAAEREAYVEGMVSSD